MKLPEENLQTEAVWVTTITPKAALLSLNLREIFQYRNLISSFVKRDFVSFYKQTLLGPIWYVIQPLASSLIMYLVFTRIARLPTDNIPPFLFYLSGNLLWIYFSENILKTADTFIQNANIFGKVYFPRLVVPISISISGLISVGIQFVFFLGFYGYYVFSSQTNSFRLEILFFPLIVIHVAINSFAFGVIISALTNKYRDLRFTLKFGMQLWMFGSPVAYSATQVPAEHLGLYMLNPMAPAIEAFRFIFFGTSIVSAQDIAVSAAGTVLLLLASIILFNKVEKTFMDTV